MRGKNTFKRIFKKNIIIGIILFSIVALSGIGITININNGIKNHIDGYSDADVSKMNITPEDIIKKAIELGNRTGNTYNGGCIDFVNTTIREVVNSKNGTCSLGSTCSGWDKNSSINGVSLENAVIRNVDNTNKGGDGRTWFSLVEDKFSLQPGDIIIGDGHAMIFLGNADGYGNLRTILERKYGVSFYNLNNYFTDGGDIASYYKDYAHTSGRTNMGSTYWVIDVNGENGHARVSDYNWSSTEQGAKSKNLDHMKVYRFKKDIKGQYHLNIAKRSNTDNSALANKRGINGVKIKVTNTTNKETATYTTGKINDNCYGMIENFFGNTTITKDNVNTPDVYTLEETNTVAGYEKLDLSNIRIAVYKKISSDKTKYIVDYVRINNASGKEFAHANAGETKNGECKVDINGDNIYDIGLEVYRDGSGLCVTIRNKPEGKYHINLVKKATWDKETDKNSNRYQYALGGAKFEMYRKIGEEKYKGVNAVENDNNELVSIEGKLAKIAFKNRGSNSTGDITVNENNWNIPDEFEITETEAPAGYFNEGRTLKFKVHKTNDYKIKGISVGDSTKVWEYTGENMDYGGAIWIRIDKDGNVIDKNAANKEDYVIALDFNQTAITITYKDPPEGSYRLHIAKKPSNSVSENEYKDCLGGAEFVVKQNRNDGIGDYNLGVSRKTEDNNESAFDHDPDDVVKPENRIVRTVSGKLTEKIAFGNHGSSYLGDIKVNEDNCNKEDIYTFKETKAPFGYTNERIGLKIGITKKLSEDKKTYVIDKIKYYGIKYNVPIDKNDDSWANDLNNVITEISASGDVQWLKIGKDGSVVTDDNDCIISLDFHNTAITVTYKDKKIEGNYDISLAKFNSDDVAKITSNKDFDNLKYVPGIKYNIWDINTSPAIKEVETSETPISLKETTDKNGYQIINR